MGKATSKPGMMEEGHMVAQEQGVEQTVGLGAGADWHKAGK